MIFKGQLLEGANGMSREFSKQVSQDVDRNSDIWKQIQWCIDQVKKINFKEVEQSNIDYSQLKFKTALMFGRVGFINLGSRTIYINSFRLHSEEEKIKGIVLHELGHFIDLCSCMQNNIIYEVDGKLKLKREYKDKALGHNKQWRDIIKEISDYTHIPIHITTEASPEESAKKHNYKYVVKCKECGQTLNYKQKGQIISDVITYPNNNKWKCGKCSSISNWVFEEL